MIRFGIVGAGRIAHKFAKEVQVVQGAKLTAVASRSRERNNEFMSLYGIQHSFNTYEELAKSTEIDAVYIATPHNFHHEHAILFMKHQKHVLCEKPLAVNQLQVINMIEVAKQNNVLLMEAMWTSFLPVTRELVSRYKNNEFGKLKSIDISFGFSIIENIDESDRLLNPNLAGGSLLDLGIYPITYIYNFLNHFNFTTINVHCEMTSTNVDKTFNVSYISNDNIQVDFKVSMDETYSNQAILVFEKGEVIVPNFLQANEYLYQNEWITLPFLEEGFVHQIESFVKTLNDHQLENKIVSYQSNLDIITFIDFLRKKVHFKYPFE